MQTRTSPTDGFEEAEMIEALVVDDDSRSHDEEVLDLVAVADFLAPELHREAGAEDAAAVVSEWADGDPELIEEAEAVARLDHHEESATILHEAAGYATAA